MSELFSVRSKVVVVTGGSGYLGYAIVKALLDGGAKVVNADIATVEPSLSASFQDLLNIRCDVSSAESIRAMYNAAKNKFGHIDVLINCATFGAGYGPAGTIEKISDEDWAKGLDGTVGITFRCIREIIPFFIENKGGNIINIASMYGLVSPDPSIYGGSGQNNPVNYGAGKAAVLQLTRYCAAHLADKNIRVNSITPGPFPDLEKQPPEQFLRNLSSKTMLKRVGSPEEIAGPVVFLATDASRYMTGANIVVDGGWTAW